MTTTSSTSESVAIVSGYTRTYVSGTSGIDTSALIEAAVETKLEPAYNLAEQVAENDARIAAYEEMQGYLTDLMDTLDVLRNTSGLTATASVFDSRAAYLTASDGSDATDYVAVGIDDGIETQSFAVGIHQLATTHKIGSASQSSRDEALALEGGFSLGTVGGDSQTIAVTADMSLQDIADAVNDVTDGTGVRASILKVADDQYMLVLATVDTGRTIDCAIASGTDIGGALGLTDGGAFANELQEPQNAIVEIDGVTIESSSNTIEDALTGIQLDLYVAAPGTTITVEVEPNYSDVKDALAAFVDAYNAYREFALTNQTVGSDGTPSDAAVLFGDSILRSTNTAIYGALAQWVETYGGKLSLGAIGITFDESNNLVIDDDVLDAAIVDDFAAVAQLFEFQFMASSDDLTVLRDDQPLASGTYGIDIATDNDGNITSVSVGGDDSLFTIDGTVLTGVEGGTFAGLKLVYTGTTDATVKFTLSQGIADRLYDAVDSVADASSGTLAAAIVDLEEDSEAKTNRATRITEQAYAYEEHLISHYANLEARMAEARTMLDVVNAILDSDDD